MVLQTLYNLKTLRVVLRTLLLTMTSLFFPATGETATFDRIKIYPEDVGVFLKQGKQQFVAFGIKEGQRPVNITRQVDWKSSNPKKVTIDAKGLARIVPGVTFGQVKISCSWPKKKKKKPLQGPYLLLLRPEEEPPPPLVLTGPYHLLLGGGPDPLAPTQVSAPVAAAQTRVPSPLLSRVFPGLTTKREQRTEYVTKHAPPDTVFPAIVPTY
ncbi:MAG: hypothetical protein Kow0089_10230 [Desulfobulbaceae bacterium]